MLFNANGSINNTEDIVSLEATQLINEMVMLEGLSTEELNEFLESQMDVSSAVNEAVLMEKTIVRLDKKAKLSKAHKMAVFTIAKERKDKKFDKLVTVWKMERFLEAYLMKKYGNEALRRAKKSVADASKSKSNIVTKAANNVKKQLNGQTTK